MVKEYLKSRLPKRIAPLVRKAYYAAEFYRHQIFGSRTDLCPPESLIYVGSGEFKETGEEFLKYFIELAGLKPFNSVLDAGCGIGRMAIPLTGYLDIRGRYEGFDVMDHGIKWCQGHITRRYPNFNFQLVDIYNQGYNPKGKWRASEYRFPFEDSTFDLVCMTSVFTHMLPADMENYFCEVARVLKPGGRSLITFFLLNIESLDLIHRKVSTRAFDYQMNGYCTTNPSEPEEAIAYPEAHIRGLYQEYGLNISQPIRYGSWPGREAFLSYQDIVIAEKSLG
jgi:SAM-dependent methyltransferase